MTAEITPFQNSGERRTVYGYDSAEMGGALAMRTALTERPRSATTSVQGQTVSKTLYQRAPGNGQIAGRTVSRQLASLTGGWSDSGNLQTVIQPESCGLSSVWSTSGSLVYSSLSLDSSTGRLWSTVQLGGPSGTVYQSTSQWLSPHGTVLASVTYDVAGGCGAIADSTTEVDAFGRATKTTDNLSGLYTKYGFDPNAANQACWLGPTTIIDADGVVNALTYTAWGDVRTESALGELSTYTYDSAGNVVGTTRTAADVIGTRRTFASFDVLGRQTAFVDELERTTRTAYGTASGGGVRVTTTYNDNSTSISDYYRDGSLASLSGTAEVPVTYVAGIAADPDHSGQWQMFSQQQSNGGQNVATTYYDTFGRQTRATQSGVSVSARWHYDAVGQVDRVDNLDGTVNLYEYDARGDVSVRALDVNKNGVIDLGVDRVTKTNRVCTYYDGKSVFQTTTTIVGDATTPDYVTIDQQSLDGLRTWHQEAGQTSSTQYVRGVSPGSGTLTESFADGTATKSSFSARRLDRAVDLWATGGEASAATYQYDAFGQLEAYTDGADRTTTYAHRADGSVERMRLPDATMVTGKNVDKYGTPNTSTYPGAVTVSTPTDTLGHTKSISGNGVTPTKFGYDPLTGQLHTVTTYTGSTLDTGTASITTLNHDPATGRLASVQLPGSASASPDIIYNYGGGTLLRSVARRGATMDVDYLSGTTDPEWVRLTNTVVSPSTLEQTYHFEYDVFGRIKDVVQTPTGGASRTTAYTYTANGQLQSESQPSVAANSTTQYTYYTQNGAAGAVGAPQTVELWAGSIPLLNEDLDYYPNDRQLYHVTVGSVAYEFKYQDSDGALQRISLVNSADHSVAAAITQLEFYPLTGQLKSITTTANSTIISQTSYTYLENGLKDVVDERVYSAPAATDPSRRRTTKYEYDAQNHLKTATVTDFVNLTTPQQVYSYTYDALGNRTDSGFVPNTLNQYVSTPNTAGPTAVYDPRGNLIFDGAAVDARTFVWNAQGRLAGYTQGTKEVGFTYDYLGRRTAKYEQLWDSGQHVWVPFNIHTFAYDGDQLIGEFFQAGPSDSPRLIRSYVWGPGGMLLELIDEEVPESQRHFSMVYDGDGDIVAMVDMAGPSVVARWSYTPYGEVLTPLTDEAGMNPILFGSMFRDAETGLYWDSQSGNYYDPAWGRYLGSNGVPSLGQNTYAFNNSNPANKLSLSADPTSVYDPSVGASYPEYDPGISAWTGARDRLLLLDSYSPMHFTSSGMNWVAGKLNEAAASYGNAGDVLQDIRFGVWASLLRTAATLNDPIPGLVSLADGGMTIGQRAYASSGSAAYAVAAGTTYVAGGLTGVNAMIEGWANEDLVTGQPIGNGWARWSHGLAGAGQFLTMAGGVMAKVGVNPRIGWTARASTLVGGGACFIADTTVKADADGNAATPFSDQPIQTLHLGEWVDASVDDTGDTPTSSGQGTTAVDPATWREVDLHMPNPEEPGGDYDIDVLEPLSWIAANDATVGGWVHLTIPEMGVDGWAYVEAVKPCPQIAPSPDGHVIVATFVHLSTDVYRLQLLGEAEPIGVTYGHPIWSLDRGDWVKAGELLSGERVATEHGFAIVESVTADPAPQYVYNIEVEGDHRYLVTDAGLLVHNGTPLINCAFRRVSSQGQPIFDSVNNRRLFEPIRRANLDPPNNFPVIDRINRTTRLGTSMKTIDLTSAYASDPVQFRTRIATYIDELSTFDGPKSIHSTVLGSDVEIPRLAARRLALGVQADMLSAQQRSILISEARRGARLRNPVALHIFELF